MKSFKEEFAMLWDYADELRLKNPGSTIKMVVQRVTPDSFPHFKRFFVCFDSWKKIWEQGYRPILGLDGYFLKGSFKSELLSAIERDANNQMYPVAWVVVELECTDSWTWPQLRENRKIKLILLPQKDELVAKDLKSKSPKHWTKAFFGCHSKCDMVDNNICEAFNSSILEARYKSIITMLEEIRVKLMTRIVDKRKFCESWKHNYGPLVKKKFDKSKKDGIEWKMVWNGENGCEVKMGRKQYIVNILERICSCRSWQITGLPCQHACCAIWHMGGGPDDSLVLVHAQKPIMR
ncbi:hypothetical protein V6N13_022135 [Hibiscus sabdariffa]